jgi:hypothetical protein
MCEIISVHACVHVVCQVVMNILVSARISYRAVQAMAIASLASVHVYNNRGRRASPGRHG